jgi:polyisoprenoid-binding protein YceI
MKTSHIGIAATSLALAAFAVSSTLAQQAGGRGGAAPTEQELKTGVRLEVAPESKAWYRVREQLAGISFPNDAVGTTSDVTGVLVLGPDGAIDSANSRLTVDLRTLKSDQDQRDNYMRGTRGLNTAQHPMAIFVPKRAVGLPWPFPSGGPAQAGFQLIGDLTIYGNTTEVTWNTIATFNAQQVAGRAETSFTFDSVKMPKPQLARLLSVDDTIRLELEFRLRRLPR